MQHKYMGIDKYPGIDAHTGSHRSAGPSSTNWSRNGHSIHDKSLLISPDPSPADRFPRENAARYLKATRQLMP